MATNPQDKSNDPKAPPAQPLFGGGLFTASSPSSGGLFGNNTPKTNALFSGQPSSNAPSLFGPPGQSTGIPSLFGNTQPAQSAANSSDANKGTSMFGGLGGKSTLFQNKASQPSENNLASKSEQSNANSGAFGLFSQNAQTSLFPGSKQPTQQDVPQTSTTPAPSTGLFGNNPMTMSFSSPKEPKKDSPPTDANKKDEAKSLFGGLGAAGQASGALFGNKQSSTTLFGAQPAKEGKQGEKKEEEKKSPPGSLFNNIGTSPNADFKSMFAPKKPDNSNEQQSASSTTAPLFSQPEQPKTNEVKETPKTEKNPLFGGNAGTSLFGGNQAPSLFGNPTPNPPAASTTTAPLFNAPASNPQPSLFGTSGTPSLFSNQPATAKQTNEQPKQAENAGSLFTQNVSKADIFTNKDSSTPPKTESIKPSQNVPKQNAQPVETSSISSQAKDLKKDTTTAPTLFTQGTAPSLFGQGNTPSLFSQGNAPSLFTKPAADAPTNFTQKVEPLATMSQPKPTIEARPLDAGLSSFTENRRKEPITELEQPKPTVRSNGSETSSLAKEKTQNDLNTRDTTKNTATTESAPAPKPFSFLKPKQASTARIIDYKVLRDEEKSEMFSTFLTQSSTAIIASIKLYFTVRAEAFKPNEKQCTTEKERFMFDFTNYFVKIMGMAESSWDLASQFVQRVLVEEKYDRLLFKEQMLVSQYFRIHAIYMLGPGQTYYLNENSREFQFLVEKVVNRWNMERIGLLNLVMAHADFMHRPSDLFSYLFKHILEVDRRKIETKSEQFMAYIKDFESICKNRIGEVIGHYNSRLRDFKLIAPEDLKTMVKLVEANRDQTINELALKVLLNFINFKQAKEVPADLLEQIRHTKSFNMMPLRALVHRLAAKRHEFVPNPKDLYRYIRGDEWIDWFDIYLSESGREGLELQVGEPEQILESLCTISGPLLLDRMLSAKKGILRFFNLLRDQNMVSLYYRLLQACISDERSIGEIDEFYFRKMHFNLEYQEVIEYVVSFSEQQVHANEQSILDILEVKISLLAKILEISPDRLIELERYLFYHDYNRLKKFKGNTEETGRREGEKMVHLFLDTINITSLRGLPNRILYRIFGVLTHLLKNQQTKRIVLSALSLNRPSFAFLSTPLHSLTLNALNGFLHQVLAGNYLHDLILGYAQAKQTELRRQSFYPFRYRDSELCDLMRQEETVQEGGYYFSIYWLNQAVRVLSKQRFNPFLLFKLLEKLYIEPFANSDQQQIKQGTALLYQRSKQLEGRIPTILEPIVSAINEITVWEDICRVLDYKIMRNEGKLGVSNRLIISSITGESYRTLLYTLKLIRLAFKLNALVGRHEETAPGHFIVRTLSAIDFLSRSKISSQFSSNANKNNLLLSVFAVMQIEEDCANDTLHGVPWEAEQGDGEETTYEALIAYINENKRTIDFEVANNLLKRPVNDLFEPENSVVAVGLEVLIEIIRLAPQCSLEHTLTAFLHLKEEEKNELKAEILQRLNSLVNRSMDRRQVSHRAIEFIFNLKHNCGANKLHGSLSNRLFDEFMKRSLQVQRSGKFNAILCRHLLRELQEGNYSYEAFTEQVLQSIVGTLKFRDSFLNNYYEFKDTRQVGRMVRAYHGKQYSLLNLNQMERMVDERAIVEIGHQFDSLASIVDILMAQMLRRKHSQSLINCLVLFNSLVLANNLILLQNDLPSYSSRTNSQRNNEEPRLYLRDPAEQYIVEGVIGRLAEAQVHQKNNVVQWLLDRCQGLSDRLTSYIKFILSIDKYLYSNNPIVFTIDRQEIANLQLFCHFSPGKMNITATESFGKSTSDSIDAVQGIASNLLNRLVEMHRDKGEECIDGPYREGLRIFGYCLEWLRGKEKYGQNASHYLIRKLQKNYPILLPQGNRLLTPEAIKVLLSALSMGEKYFSAEAKAHIHDAVYALTERYWATMQRGFLEEEARAIGELFQQAVTLLIIVPPEKNEALVFETIVNIWCRQRNFQFFFNESRVVLELARHFPEEVVKLQPLTRCEIVSSLSNHYSRYSEDDEERRWEGIAWTWVVKIATELANHPLSILIVSEVSAFFKQYRARFLDLFEPGERLSKSYLEDLEAALELMACLFSHDLWVSFNRLLAEELTYLLSHKLIKVFVAYAQGRLPFFPLSSNDKALASVKSSGTMEDESAFDSMTQENLFVSEMRIRVNYCLRDYCLVMRKAFKASHYVEAYFEAPFSEGYRYYSSFWDAFNKQLISLFIYANKQLKVWGGVRKLNDCLATLTQCCNAPHSFVENGYLCTIIDLPANEYELFSDLYLLNYLLVELAAVHLLKERLYIARFNNLMSAHIDLFAKRIKEHIDTLRVQSRKLNVAMNQYVAEGEFISILDLIDAAKSTK